MSKHTLGPWTVNGSAAETDYESDNVTIAHIYDPDENGPDEYAANARLIAAAPDLLLACELVKGWIEMDKIEVGPVVWIELCRAIAKAGA